VRSIVSYLKNPPGVNCDARIDEYTQLLEADPKGSNLLREFLEEEAYAEYRIVDEFGL